MSGEPGQNWKSRIIDEMANFAESAFPDSADANGLLLHDVGQAYLLADALRSVFPTVNLAGGDAETAEGVGRVIGHYESLLLMLVHSVELRSAISSANDLVLDARDKIDAILTEHAPEGIQGPETGVIHLLSAYTSPSICDNAMANLLVFQEKLNWIMELVHSQSVKERKEFLAGYGDARACTVIGADGIPLESNKEASLAALLRPFAKKLGLTNSDFQDVVEDYAKARITGNPERLPIVEERQFASP